MREVFLVFEAIIGLLRHEHFMRGHTLKELYERVRNCPTRSSRQNVTLEQICTAVDTGIILYWKRVLCLQRSVVLVGMCRRYGISARMMTGVQRLPFKAHAWVEVDQQIINDPVATKQHFRVMEVC